MASLTAVILCGGAGVRLWPLSRERHPKQFLDLLGPRTLLQETVARGLGVADRPPFVICNEAQRFLAAEQMRELGVRARIILEPAGRDSGPAIAAAAEIAARDDPDGLLLVLPSDHSLPDVAAFAASISAAREAAEAGFIVTFGIAPTRPASEFGYVRPGGPTGAGAVVRAAAFIEKPDAERAAACIREGGLWNSGMLLFRARALLDDLALFEPAMAAAAAAAVDGLVPDHDFERLGADAFLSSPAKSIDYAVMERTERAAMLPVSFAWSDVGNWAALWDAAARDSQGNTTLGPVELRSVRNSYVRSEGLLTAVLGLEDVVVIATDDAVLVAAKEEAQHVKEIVGRLKTEGRSEVISHPGVFRPWGLQQSLDRGPGFEVKRLVIRPGQKISLQRHRHRSEHWVIVRGLVLATLGEHTRAVHPNESVFVPAGMLHRLANPGPDPAEIIEVRTGENISEDDVERMADDYGRAARPETEI